jgi:hypothetical protein
MKMKSVPPKLRRSAKVAGNGPTTALRKAIRSGFSDDEIPEILARLLVIQDASTVERFAESLGPERGQTLRDVLCASLGTPKATHKQKPAPGAPLGPGRARQDWEKAWADWEAVIEESNDEHGEYVHQEHHWEAPYFWPGDVADALEPIATRMRPLIPKLVEAGVDPKFSFLEALRESLAETAAGLEDWMGAWERDGMEYGPEVTTCLFEAEWAWTRRRNGDLAEVIERIQEFELTNKKAGFNHRAAVAFLTDLPRDELLQIATSLARGPAEKRSRWMQTAIDQLRPKRPPRSKPGTQARKGSS